jgi:hyperosmotically inducible periplasmic protein
MQGNPIMKTLIATLIATAVSAVAVAVAPASAAPVDKDAHRAAMDKAAADYRSAKAKCDAKSGNAEEVCEDEAKLAQARAELDAYTRYDTTGGNLRDARAKVIRAEHELADTQCDATASGDKDRCKATAGSIRDAALARLDDRNIDRAVGPSSSGELVSSIDSKDPATAAAVQKCEQMTGDARTACVVDQRGNVTTATNVASTTGAAVAANTREAARNAADKTREVASNVAEKTGMAGAGERTREAVATVKEKTAAAVDRTREMASNAVRKTENATERAGEKTARVASDSTITTKVKAGLVADPALKGMEISVDTEGGVVMLSGFVESKAEADKAMQVAKGVDGVTNVKSAIKVK